jgi:surfeit locus 1 family protein
MAGVWKLARRPKWIALLVLALAVAGVFAAMGQWQLERAAEDAIVVERDTETPTPLPEIAEPQQLMTSDASGRIVTVDGAWVEGDDLVVTGRQTITEVNGSRDGDWVVRHFRTTDGASLAVAVGVLPPGASIPAVETGAASLTGRYVPSESPQSSDFEAGERSAIAVADLVNVWPEPGPVYSGYLVLSEAPEGFATIPAPPPAIEGQLNLLNLFYAIEWVIFGGFALYLWWRLLRDEYEKEQAAAGEPDDASGDAERQPSEISEATSENRESDPQPAALN